VPRPFHAPILRYFALWMLVFVVSYYVLIQMAAGRTLAVNATSGDLLMQLVGLLPLFWFLFHSLNDSLPLRYFARPGMLPFKWYRLLGWVVAWILLTVGLDGTFRFGLSWLLPGYIKEAADLQIFLPSDAPAKVILTFLLAGFIAPVMEELVFRGLILQRLAVKFGYGWAIITSSLVFGLLHMEGWSGATAFAVFMCLIYLHTRNIWVPIVLHILNNMGSLVLEYVLRHQVVKPSVEELRSELAYSMICLLILPVIISFIKKYWRPDEIELPYDANRLNST